MAFNPFEEKPMKPEKCFENWKTLFPKPYDKNEVDPYTRLRIILMNGAEMEAARYSHAFSRHCNHNDLRRELSLLRRIEQQQQKKLSFLKPADESLLETAVCYEQMSVELTADLAENEPDKTVKMALEFALPEDFDHLYRFADLLNLEDGIRAEKLVGEGIEIMPGRPSIAAHRHPYDDIRRGIDGKSANLITRLNVGIITAAEQLTMNFYMNAGPFCASETGRKLFAEIAMIEEQHVSQYGSLCDPNSTWLEGLLLREYTECYLYYSLYEDETDARIKEIWEENLAFEIAHLHRAAALLTQFEQKEWEQVISGGAFPTLLGFSHRADKNKQFIRENLRTSVNQTAILEEYTDVKNLPDNYQFFKYNDAVNKSVGDVASHNVIETYIMEAGEDYRNEDDAHPVEALRDRKRDNTRVGRTQ